MKSLITYFNEQSTESLTHAQSAGELLVSLGGHPSQDISIIDESNDHSISSLLSESLEHERKAVSLYKDLLTEVENKRNSETLFSTDWIDKVNTGASHVLRQISHASGVNIGIATDGEIDGSYAHSNAKKLSIPYRLRLNVLKNMKSLFKQSQISDEFESNRKSLQSEGSVCILIEVVDAGLTISSCTVVSVPANSLKSENVES